MTDTVLALENLSIDEGRSRIVDRVSLSVSAGSVYVLLGRPKTGKSSLVRCAVGQLKPSEGRALLFGRDARKHRKKLWERVGVVTGEIAGGGGFARELDRSPELLVLDDPTLGLGDPARREVLDALRGKLAERGNTVFLATSEPADIEAIADRVGILSKGRLVIDEDPGTLVRRFRRISYRNEITETRTEYGNELDHFNAVRVRVRGWGVDAVVSNFDHSAFEAFRSQDGVTDASAAPMSLAEIFAAVAGDPASGGPSR